jgi:hypothetical protein
VTLLFWETTSTKKDVKGARHAQVVFWHHPKYNSNNIGLNFLLPVALINPSNPIFTSTHPPAHSTTHPTTSLTAINLPV